MAVLKNWQITCQIMDLEVCPGWDEDDKDYLGKPNFFYVAHGNVFGNPKFSPGYYIHTSAIKKVDYNEDEKILRVYTQNSLYECYVRHCAFDFQKMIPIFPPLALKALMKYKKQPNHALERIFVHTQICYESISRFRQAVEDSINGTRFYAEDETPELPEPRYPQTVVSVQRYRSFNTAQFYKKKYPKDRIAVHNFASSRGSDCKIQWDCGAQEASLVRISTLYPVLEKDTKWQKEYEEQRKIGNRFYTDACLYTPKIVIFKADTDTAPMLPEEEWTEVDVLTCAAPDLNPHSFFKTTPPQICDEKLLAIHKRRGRQILSVAAANGADIVILGAFGCRPFRYPPDIVENAPEIVADAYAEILPEFNGQFRFVIFAVDFSIVDFTNYRAFVDRFTKVFDVNK